MKGMRPLSRTRKPQGAKHPTYIKLVEATGRLLANNLAETISAEDVMRESGVSRGSLYHHFEDISDLLETAMVAEFSHIVDSNITFISSLIDSAKTVSDFYRATLSFNKITQSAERRSTRFDRMRLIGLAYQNERLRSKIAVEQDRLTNAYRLFKNL